MSIPVYIPFDAPAPDRVQERLGGRFAVTGGVEIPGMVLFDKCAYFS
jgi:hypothetical protein